ncbi:MAG: aspartate aminotransferase family protein [Marinobacterium sp.]|nr:aspartate aminotransferase family protein [Marinobacterium sp.]
MSHVFHRNLHTDYPTAVKGDGIYLIDKNGKRYLDGCGGAAVSCLGHSDENVIEAMKAQLDQLAWAHSGFFTTEPMEQLASFLATRAPEGIEHIYFVSGGSEATESALKMARQYFVERGQPQRRHIIARRQSYHGNTLGALAAGGNQWRRQQFEPLLVEVRHVSACNEYRDKENSETTTQYCQRLLTELEREIERLGPQNVMAFMAEPVVGATMGAVPAVEGYFKGIREICDRHGILLILDEVMCGMGRTGSLFVADQEGIAPDIICVAKGLGAGYQPIGATLVSNKIYQAIKEGSGFFQHGHTYIGHAMACAAALAVQQRIEQDHLLANVQHQGNRLRAALEAEFGDHPFVGNVRGRGLFQGLELVQDKNSKTPFDPALKINARIKAKALENGLMCYPMGGTINGYEGDHILLAPPFIMNDEQNDELVRLLTLSCQQVFDTL